MAIVETKMKWFDIIKETLDFEIDGFDYDIADLEQLKANYPLLYAYYNMTTPAYKEMFCRDFGVVDDVKNGEV